MSLEAVSKNRDELLVPIFLFARHPGEGTKGEARQAYKEITGEDIENATGILND